MSSDASDRPIFVLGACQRTGSTVVQRLLNSHDDVFLWGEHDGALDGVLAAVPLLRAWNLSNGKAAAREYHDYKGDGFIANLSPNQDVVEDSIRSTIRALFADNFEGCSSARWGFKEVRYRGDVVTTLLELFPLSRLVFVYRDVLAVMLSLRTWELDTSMSWKPEWTIQAVEAWVDSMRFFSTLKDPRVFALRYESLLEEPEIVVSDLETRVGLNSGSIDRGVLGRRIHAPGAAGRATRVLATNADLTPALTELLNRTDVAEMRATSGYV